MLRTAYIRGPILVRPPPPRLKGSGGTSFGTDYSDFFLDVFSNLRPSKQEATTQGRAQEFEKRRGRNLKPSVFRLKLSKEQKKAQHVRRCPIFRPKVK